MIPPQPPSRRLQRVSELIKRELAELLRREVSVEKVGLLNINEVKVAPDLRSAIVFVGHVGTPSQRLQATGVLDTHAKLLNLRLGAALRLKWTPVLHFKLDDSVSEAARVLTIIEEMERVQQTRPGSEPGAPPLAGSPESSPSSAGSSL